MSQRRSSPCGLFSRAEDKLKLSDDVIEEAITHIRDSLSSFISRAPQSPVVLVNCQLWVGRMKANLGLL